MTVMTSTGLVVAIVAAAPATFDQAGFEALTFVDIGELTDVPEFGPEITPVDHMALASGEVQTRAGFVNYGSTNLSMGLDLSDEGQEILQAAVEFGSATFGTDHSISITYPNDWVQYLYGVPLSFKYNPSGANSIVGATANIKLNKKDVKVDPNAV